MKKSDGLFFNWKLLLVTLLIVSVLGGAVFLVHRQQIKSISSEHLQLAATAKEKGEWREARSHIERYLLQHPDDAAKRAEYAELFDKSATTPNEKRRAVALYLTAIGVCESKEELAPTVRQLRRNLAERQFELGEYFRQDGYYSDAVDQIAVVAEEDWDPPLVRLFALCRFMQVRMNVSDQWSAKAESEAPDWLKNLAQSQSHYLDVLDKALLQNPGDIQLSEAIIDSCLQSNTRFAGSTLADSEPIERIARARVVADQMLAANRESPDAALLYCKYAERLYPEMADEMLAESLERFPEYPAIRRFAGKKYLQQATKMDSKDADFLVVLTKAEENLKAASSFQKGIEPSDAIGLGQIQELRGDDEGAIRMWQESIRSGVASLEGYERIIRRLIKTRQLDRAHESLVEMDKFLEQGSQELRLNGQSKSSSIDEVLKSQNLLAKSLWASYHLSKNDHESAIPLLEFLVSAGTTRDPATRARDLMLLGDAYSKSQQWDRAGTVYEQACDLFPNEPLCHSRAANAWRMAGRFSQALTHLNSISSKSTAESLIEALVILSIQSSPTADRSLWGQFDKTIESLMAAAADSSRSESIRADQDSADDLRGNVPVMAIEPWVFEHLKIQGLVLRASSAARPDAEAEATAKLVELCRSQPKNADLWRQTFAVLRSWGQKETSDILLEEFRLSHPDSEYSLLSKADQLRRDRKFTEARQLLVTALEATDNAFSPQRFIELALLCCEDQTQWMEIFERLLKWSDKSLVRSKIVADASLSVIVFGPEVDSQMALREGKEMRLKLIRSWSDAVQKIELQIKAIEGDQGTEWKAIRGQRLLKVAEFDPNLDLQPIVEVARNLESQRPLWTTSHVVAGLLAERMGDLFGAIRSLNRAVSLGEKKVGVQERLVLLMFQQGMYAEARTIIDQMGMAASASSAISNVAMNLPGDAQGDLLDLAQAGIDARPIDPLAWIWYGQILESTSRKAPAAERQAMLAKALDAFDKSAQLSGNRDPRALNAEFAFYALLKDRVRLENLLARLESATNLDESNKCLLMAKVEQVLGKHSEAEANFQKAMEAGGSRMEIGLMLAKHHLFVGDTELAMSHFEKLYQDFPKEFSIRQSLVNLLRMRNAAEDWDRIRSILLDPRNANEVQDRRYLAELYLQRGTPSELEQGKALLEDIVNDSTLRTNNDSFLLAQACERLSRKNVGKFANERERLKLKQIAGKHFRVAAEGPKPDPKHVKAFGDYLLESKQIDEAIAQCKLLQAIAPNEFTTALLDAAIKNEQGKHQEAIDVVLSWQSGLLSRLGPDVPPVSKQMIQMDSIRGLLLLGAFKEADEKIDDLMQSSPDAARDCLALNCQLLDRTARSHALARLVDYTDKNSRADGPALLARILGNYDFEPETLTRADNFLIQRDSQNTPDATTHMVIGDMWLNRANIPQAIQSYRYVISIKPDQIQALNNLACLIAESTGETEESLTFIDQALKLDGANPDLLDSKGLILLQQGKHGEAAPLFEAAAAKGRDPRYVFHWYIALMRSGRAPEAARLRARIDVDALRTKHLSPDDAKELEKFDTASL